MTVFHLVGFQSQRPPQKLIAEANSEEGNPAVQHFAEQCHVTLRGTRIAGSVRVKDRVRLDSQHVLDGHGVGHNVHVKASRREMAECGLLHPEVKHHDSPHHLPFSGNHIGFNR